VLSTADTPRGRAVRSEIAGLKDNMRHGSGKSRSG